MGNWKVSMGDLQIVNNRGKAQPWGRRHLIKAHQLYWSSKTGSKPGSPAACLHWQAVFRAGKIAAAGRSKKTCAKEDRRHRQKATSYLRDRTLSLGRKSHRSSRKIKTNLSVGDQDNVRHSKNAVKEPERQEMPNWRSNVQGRGEKEGLLLPPHCTPHALQLGKYKGKVSYMPLLQTSREMCILPGCCPSDSSSEFAASDFR